MVQDLERIFTVDLIANEVEKVEKGDKEKVLKYFNEKNYDIVPVEENGKIIGYYRKPNMKLNKISINNLLTKDTSLKKTIEFLTEDNFKFIIVDNKIKKIVAKADWEKQSMRSYLFSLISNFEIIANEKMKDEGYDGEKIRKSLSKKRIEKAEEVFQEKKSSNNEIDFLHCLTLIDKKTIIKKDEVLWDYFKKDYSKTKYKTLFKKMENLRNALAHMDPLESRVKLKKLNEIIDYLYYIVDKYKKEMN